MFTYKADISTIKNVRRLLVLILKGSKATIIAYTIEVEVIEYIVLLSLNSNSTYIKYIKKGTTTK